MATRAEVREQRELLARLSDLAGADLARRWARMDTRADLEELRPLTVELLSTLVALYGEAAAGLAADFYETARAAGSARGRYTPPMADALAPPVADALTAAAIHALGGVLQGDPGMTQRSLTGSLDLHVKGSYRRTIADAVAHDPDSGAAWERMPSGGGGCDFCQEVAGTPADGFHPHCRCMSVPVWR